MVDLLEQVIEYLDSLCPERDNCVSQILINIDWDSPEDDLILGVTASLVSIQLFVYFLHLFNRSLWSELVVVTPLHPVNVL